MGGLGRIVSLYKLLERVQEAEAMAARSAVGEVDAQLERLREGEAEIALAARGAPEDAVLRTAAQHTTESHAVLRGRLAEVRTERVAVAQQAAEALAQSRLRVRQVETVLTAERQLAELEASKREQAQGDERFLVQRRRAEQQRDRDAADGPEQDRPRS